MTSESPATPRPDLGALEAELDDTEHVLACLERTEPGLCDVCLAADASGTLAERPALKVCAEARQQAST
ncbi:MAG: hypothetical protein ACR2N9_02885 [Acidimicrobiia bacterium]